MKKRTLAESVAQKLEADLGKFSQESLPSLRELSRLYNVSFMTMRRVAGSLKARGLLTYSRGSLIRKYQMSVPPALPERRESSAHNVYRSIKELIGSTHLKAGQPLPKLEFFIRELSVSARTVRSALQKLSQEDLLYRAGKRWIVGRRPAEASLKLHFGEAPVILILQAKPDLWRSLYFSARTTNFCKSFHHEVQRAGYQLAFALTNPPGPGLQYIPCGMDQVRMQIIQWGDRYKGALICDSRDDNPDIDSWFRFLLPYQKPVVWFDRYDQEQPEIVSPLFKRCHFNERIGHEFALRILYEAGHRKIGYVFTGPMRQGGWIEKRYLELKAIAESLPEDTCVYRNDSVPAEVIEWKSISDGRWAQILKHLHQCGIRAVRRHIDSALIKDSRNRSSPDYHQIKRLQYDFIRTILDTPLLVPLLREKGVTALIAANDRHARHIYTWLCAMGIKVPHEVSIISFDSSIKIVPYPVSSVDFGFGSLGYAAFQLLSRFLPVPRKNSSFAAVAAINDQGSIALPRKSALRSIQHGAVWAPV